MELMIGWYESEKFEVFVVDLSTSLLLLLAS